MAHDYRYNPYTDIVEPIAIVSEVHRVPINAPYYVRLRETPLKESPSTTSARYYDDDAELTEVSASPAQGQYWPDYSTANEGWNTGLVRFSPADAGKLIKISYKGIGTQASVKCDRYPSWQLERGTGVLGDHVCSNGETFSGVYNYKSLTVPEGVSIYIDRTARILCQGHFINKGVINGVGRAGSEIGFCAGQGGKGGDGRLIGGIVGTIGNRGLPAAESRENYVLGYSGSATNRLIDTVVQCNQYDIVCGSRGGTGALNGQDRPGGLGGMGGSSIFVVAQTFINFGTITMMGAQGAASGGYNDGGGGGGGGGGGAIIAVAAEILNGGTVSVSGGAGGAGSGGAASGNVGYDGWIRILELGV